ncbi:MAG: Ig-like domain-containing protein [Propionibacteriaceae bacterium]|jgi:adhesin/invasin|nr:Ig-like domain-containing protein [Propionibacteriaceae bacterium]
MTEKASTLVLIRKVGAVAVAVALALAGLINLAAPAGAASKVVGAYDKIFYFTDVRWWSDANPGDGVCATSTTNASGAPQGSCTLLAATQEANAWSAAHPNDAILITPAEATLAGSLTGLNPYSSWNVKQANWAIAPLDDSHNGGSRHAQESGFNGMLPYNAAGNNTVSVLGGVTDATYGERTTMLYFSANNLTVDLQNRVGFWVDGDQCWSTNSGTCSTVMGFNGTNQIFQNFGTEDTATTIGEGYGLMMVNSEGDVYVGQNARNITIRNGYIGNLHTTHSAMGVGGTYANERGIVIVGGAQDVLIDNVAVDSLAGSGIALVPNKTDTATSATPIKNLTIQNCNISMSGKQASGNSSYLGVGISGIVGRNASDNSLGSTVPPTVENLQIINNTFEDFPMTDAFGDATPSSDLDRSVPMNLSFVKIRGTQSKINGNTIIFDWTENKTIGAQFADVRKAAIIISNSNTPLEIANNSFSHTDNFNNPQFAAISLAFFNDSYSGPISDVWIHDNTVSGWGTAANATIIRARAQGNTSSISYLAERNTSPNSLSTTTATPENDTGNTPSNPIDNAGPNTTVRSNNNVKTWYPSNATVSGSQLSLTVNPPSGGTGNDPVYPVQLDVYASPAGVSNAASGMASYVGRVTITSAAAATVTLPYAGGAAGYVRLQTIDANGNSSQMSRVATATGNDTVAPMLWIDRRPAQPSPTSLRKLSFTMMSSEPLNGGANAITPAMFTNAGTAGAFSSVVVAPLSSTDSNTQWLVTFTVDQSGTVIPTVAAGVVSDLSGNPNAATNTLGLVNPAGDDGKRYAPSNFVGSPTNNGVGYAIDALPGGNLVDYVSPIYMDDTAAVLAEGQPADSLMVNLTTNAVGTANVAPVAYIYVKAISDGVTPDSTVNPVTQTALSVPQNVNDIATQVPNNPDLGSVDPYGSAGNATTQTLITPIDVGVPIDLLAVDNAIVDGARSVSAHLQVISADPNYNGLTLPNISFTVADNDAPSATVSTIVTTVDNAIANDMATDTVVLTVKNAAGVVVQNAKYTLTIPADVTIRSAQAGGAQPGSATISGQTVVGYTGSAGTVTLTLSSLKSAAYPVSATIGALADGSDAATVGSGTTATFVPGPVNLAHSTIQASPTIVTVVDTSTVTVTLRDVNDNIVTTENDASKVVITTSLGNLTAVSGSAGVFTATVSSSTTGTANLGLSYNGTPATGPSSSATVKFTVGVVDPGQSGLTTVITDGSSSVDADGLHSWTATITPKDASGNAISGITDFALNNLNGVVASTVTESLSNPGTYTALLTSTTAQTVTGISATTGGVTFGAATVEFVPGPVSASQSLLNVSVTGGGSIAVAGVGSWTATITTKDAQGNLIDNLTGITLNNLGNVQATAPVRMYPGIYMSLLTSDVAGVTSGITATAQGVTFGNASVTFVAGVPDFTKTKIEIGVLGPVIVGDFTDPDPDNTAGSHEITVTVVDAFYNPIVGADVTLVGTPTTGLNYPTAPQATDASGKARFEIWSLSDGAFPFGATVTYGNSTDPVTQDNDGANDGTVYARFDPDAPSYLTSTLSVTDVDKIAGVQTHTATVTLFDKHGNNVSTSGECISALVAGDAANIAGLVVGAVSEGPAGVCSYAVSSTKAGTFVLHAYIGANELIDINGSPAEVTFVAGPADASTSTLSVDHTTVSTDDPLGVTATATVLDAYGNPVANETVTFSLTGGTPAVGASGSTVGVLSSATCDTDGTGQCFVAVPSTVAGTVDLNASITAGAITGSPKSLTYTSGAIDLASSTITAQTPKTVEETSLVTITLRDMNGNVVTSAVLSQLVLLPSAGSNTDTPTGSNGVFTANMNSHIVGNYTVGFSYGGNDAAATAPVQFTVGVVDLDASTIDAVPVQVLADGTAASSITVTLTDQYGNVVTSVQSGVAVTTSFGTLSLVTGANGVFGATLTSAAAGDASLGFTYNVPPVTAGTQTAHVEFIVGSICGQGCTPTPGVDADHQTRVVVTTNNQTADDNAEDIATAYAFDISGNPVAGAAITITPDAGLHLVAGTYTTEADGSVAIPFTSAVASIHDASFLIGGVVAQTGPSVSMTFVPGPVSLANSTIVVTPNPTSVDSTATVEVTLYDANHNLITAIGAADVTISVATGGAGLTGSVSKSGLSVYSQTLASTVAGSGTVTFAVAAVIGTAPTAAYTFTHGAVDLANTLIELDPASQTVGYDIGVTLTLRDSFGNVISDVAPTNVSLVTTFATASSVVLNGPAGTYEATLSSPVVGNDVVGAAVVGALGVSPTEAYEFVNGVLDPNNSELLIDPATTPVGDTTSAGATVTVIARDVNGFGITGLTGFTLSLPGDVVVGVWTDNNDGTYDATITSTLAAAYTGVTATSGSATFGDADVEFVAGPVSLADSLITVDPASQTAGSLIDVSVTLKDAFGNVVTSVAAGDVTLTPSFGNGSALTLVSGVYVGTLSSTAAGTGTVGFTVTSVSGTSPTAAYGFTTGAVCGLACTPDVSVDADHQTRVVVTTNNQIADGTAQDVVTAYAFDVHGNPIAGAAVMATPAAGLSLVPGTYLSGADGSVTVPFTSTVAAGHDVSFTIGGEDPRSGSPATLTFVAGPVSLADSLISVDPASQTAGSLIDVSVTLKDAFGNVVTSVAAANVALTPSFGSASGLTLTSGSYKGTLSSTAVGTGTVGFTVASVSGTSPTAAYGFTAGAVCGSGCTPAPGVDADHQTRVVVTTNNQIANGTAQDVVTAYAFDANGNAVSGATVAAVPGTGLSLVAGTYVSGGDGSAHYTTDASGSVTAPFTSTVAGSHTASFTIDGVAPQTGSPATLAFVAGPPDSAQSTLSVVITDTAHNTVVADGIESYTATVTAKDAQGNLISGLVSNISLVGLSADATVSSWTETSPGVYTATVISTAAAANAGVSAQIGSASGVGPAQTVTFIAPPAVPAITSPTGNSSTTSSTPTITGDNGTPGNTITVTDENGDVLCTAIVAPEGTWSCAPTTPLPDGEHSVKATETDPDGRVAGPSAEVTFNVDSSIPAPPKVNTPTDGKTITGTGEPGNTIDITDGNGNTLCTTTVAPDGTWSCIPANPPAEGSVITVTQTNPLGNTSSGVDIRIGMPYVALDVKNMQHGSQTEQIARGYNFQPGEVVTATMHSDPLDLGTQVANTNGQVVFTWTVPAATPVGTHEVVLDGSRSGQVSDTFNITAAPGLPNTGAQGGTTGALGMLALSALVLLACCATVASKRRYTDGQTL